MNERVIIITGGNGGIGLESVKQFLTDNYVVIAISKSTDNLLTIHNQRLEVFACDVCDYQKLKLIFEQVLSKYQRIDGVINNAGVVFSGEFLDMSHTDIQKMIDVNIKGLTNVLELVIPVMRQKKSGTIINISSLADRNVRPLTAVYAATKAYVKSISDSLRMANAKYNIRITSISPASVKTPMLDKLRPHDDVIAVEQFVKVLKFIYEQPQEISIRDMVIAPTSYES